MADVRLGVIGMGGAGRAHARRFARHRHIAGVCGFDPRPGPPAAIEILTDLDAFLDRVDAVSICSPDHTHFQYIRQCLEAGKHVLVEKPMVTSSDDAQAVRALVTEHPGQRFAVHHQMRCVPAFQRARRFIADGTLGRIFYVESNYWHDMRDRWMKFDTWRGEGAGQSVIFGGACHPLDLICHLVDAPLVEHHTVVSGNAFSAWPGRYTAATTVMQFSNGVSAKSHTSFCCVYPQLNDLVVLGDRGSYVDGVLCTEAGFCDTNSYLRIARATPWRRKLLARFAQAPATALAARLARTLPAFRSTPFSVYEHDAACNAIIENFMGAIVDGTPVLVGAKEGSRVVELCEAAERDGLAQDRLEKRAA